MARYYSDPSREHDAHALPDIEVFYAEEGSLDYTFGQEEPSEAGWYYWICFPGCMPDSDPTGPFGSEAEALTDARSSLDGK